MTSIITQISDDLKAAMRAGDSTVRDTLRMLKSSMTLMEVELGRPLDDGDAREVLTKARKSRAESVAQYRDAGRMDLAEREAAEQAVIERYLPSMLSEEALRPIAQDLVKRLGLHTKKDMGAAMAALREEHPDQIDGKVAARVLGQLLS